MTPTGSGEAAAGLRGEVAARLRGEVAARLRGEVVARLRDERAELLAEGPPDGRAWCLAWTDKVDRAIAQLREDGGAGSVSVLAIGLVYEWKKGGLEWV